MVDPREKNQADSVSFSRGVAEGKAFVSKKVLRRSLSEEVTHGQGPERSEGKTRPRLRRKISQQRAARALGWAGQCFPTHG